MKNLKIKTKLITLFILIKVIPLIIISYISYKGIIYLEDIFDKESKITLRKSYEVVENTANIAVEDSIKALDKKSQEALEVLTNNVAKDVSDFLYARDKDLLFLSKIENLSESLIKNFYETHTKEIIVPQEFKYDDINNKWVPTETLKKQTSLMQSELEYNKKYFNHIEAKNFKTKSLRLYKEISFINLEGQEKIKVSSINKELQDISIKENTYCKAENYFNEIKKLKKGEIYVSNVIGEYVASNIIGSFTKQRAMKLGIDFKPENHGYAGYENPKGKKFDGIIRFITPKFKNNEKVGYISLALDHRHIMEYTDYLIPTKESMINYSDASRGNYAFMWDNKGRNISHTRDYFIVGYNKETGEKVMPWLSLDLAKKLEKSNNPWQEFLDKYPSFENQSLKKKANVSQIKNAGNIALDCRYLNFAPQCAGWMQVTKDGGYGSFVIYWSNVWKLTTVATIPYYTGQYSKSKRGFGFVTFGANLSEFHEAANKTKENIDKLVDTKLNDIKEVSQKVDAQVNDYVKEIIEELSLSTLIMTLIVIAIALWIANYITTIIQELIEGIERFQNNDLDYKIKVRSKDEIGKLADSFNIMASSIKDQFRKIQEQEKTIQKQSRLAQMGEMISIIAHQWRQPLGAISSAILSVQIKLQINKYNLENKEERQEFLDFLDKKHNNVNEYVQFLSNTIDDFRNFFKPQKEKEKVAFNYPIKKALDIVNVSMSNKGIKIKSKYYCKEEIYLYNNELMQVILSILKNAEDNFIEKNTQSPLINVITKKEENNYVILINDNGGGIPENILPKIFDVYFSTKNEKNGTGLGLYMSKLIIEDHHKGALDVINTSSGAQFSIKIPIFEEVYVKN